MSRGEPTGKRCDRTRDHDVDATRRTASPACHMARLGTVHPVRHHEDRRDEAHGIWRGARTVSADAQRLSVAHSNSADEAERICTLLSDGGVVFMAMEGTSLRFASEMLRDKFGTSWMILALKPQAAP